MKRTEVLGIVMAGGEGTRLYPLTRDRAKPAVPFGGKYRIIDFVLSNFINSEMYSIYVLVQFKSQSLIEHLNSGWQIGGLLPDHFITAVPAQMRLSKSWYQGSADAVYQSLHLITNFDPDIVAVFGADHIYRMDITQMLAFHRQRGADVTVAAFPVPVREASAFGVIQIENDGKIVGFEEKLPHPTPIPGEPNHCLASMGNYLFNASTLIELLEQDAKNDKSSHDFGRDILPALVGRKQLYAYDFRYQYLPGEPEDQVPYWRDVGTLDAYYEANMDLRAVSPQLNLYNPHWPIRTVATTLPPAKFTFNEEGRRGTASNSLVSVGCIVSGGTVFDSILGRNVFVHSFSQVEASVIMDNCHIRRHARVRRAIIDKNVQVPEGESIGWDLERDKKRFTVTENGIVVVPRNYRFDP